MHWDCASVRRGSHLIRIARCVRRGVYSPDTSIMRGSAQGADGRPARRGTDMDGRTMRALMALTLALGFTSWGTARAAEPCSVAAPPPTTWGERVAAAACAEHRLWYSPFLDERGRLASTRVSEAENARLQDGTSVAWRRVVDYWKGTGLLTSFTGRPGAYECGYAMDTWPGSAACRAFVVD